MSKKREYDGEYKVQAVKLAKTLDQQKQQQRSCKSLSTRCMAGYKSKNSRAGHRLRRTQPGRSIEHCQRESAAEKADQGVGKRKSSSE